MREKEAKPAKTDEGKDGGMETLHEVLEWRSAAAEGPPAHNPQQ